MGRKVSTESGLASARLVGKCLPNFLDRGDITQALALVTVVNPFGDVGSRPVGVGVMANLLGAHLVVVSGTR